LVRGKVPRGGPVQRKGERTRGTPALIQRGVRSNKESQGTGEQKSTQVVRTGGCTDTFYKGEENNKQKGPYKEQVPRKREKNNLFLEKRKALKAKIRRRRLAANKEFVGKRKKKCWQKRRGK